MKDPQFSTNQQRQHSNCTRQLPPSQEQIPTRKVPINNKNHELQITGTKTARNITNETGLRHIQNDKGPKVIIQTQWRSLKQQFNFHTSFSLSTSVTIQSNSKHVD